MTKLITNRATVSCTCSYHDEMHRTMHLRSHACHYVNIMGLGHGLDVILMCSSEFPASVA